MTKVVQFPSPNPEKFGFRPVRKKKPGNEPDDRKQLSLFTGGKQISFHQHTPFDEALMLDEMHDPRAKETYQKAIEAGDSKADAYCNLGILESKENNYSKAIDCFTLCLKEDPRHFEAHYNLANVYADIGNLGLAKIHYQISIEIEPEFPNSYFNLGLTLAMNQELPEAIRALHSYYSLASPEDRVQAEELIASLSRSLSI